MNRIAMIYYKVGTIIMNLMVLNILWIAHIMLGGIILGIGPSTLALMAMIRQIQMKENVSYRSYFKYFKEYFILGNKWFYIILVCGYILSVQYQYLSLTYSNNNIAGQLAFYLTIALIFILLNLVIVTSCIVVHFILTEKQVIKWSIYILGFHPYILIFSIIWCISNVLVVHFFPGLYFFIGVSSNAWVIYSMIAAIFKRYEFKKEGIQS